MLRLRERTPHLGFSLKSNESRLFMVTYHRIHGSKATQRKQGVWRAATPSQLKTGGTEVHGISWIATQEQNFPAILLWIL